MAREEGKKQPDLVENRTGGRFVDQGESREKEEMDGREGLKAASRHKIRQEARQRERIIVEMMMTERVKKRNSTREPRRRTAATVPVSRGVLPGSRTRRNDDSDTGGQGPMDRGAAGSLASLRVTQLVKGIYTVHSMSVLASRLASSEPHGCRAGHDTSGSPVRTGRARSKGTPFQLVRE